jgi:hypothetical protein
MRRDGQGGGRRGAPSAGAPTARAHDRLVAAVATVLWHAGIAWLAGHAARPAPAAPPPAMVLAWIREVPTVPAVAPDQAARRIAAPPAAATRGLTARFVARPGVAGRTSPAHGVPVTTLPDAWALADRTAAIGPGPSPNGFRPDPFEHRATALPGGGAHRFRMRAPRSPADLVTGAATFLGLRPEGYEDSPCPRIARNITALSTSFDAADRAALAHALEMRDALCR